MGTVRNWFFHRRCEEVLGRMWATYSCARVKDLAYEPACAEARTQYFLPRDGCGSGAFGVGMREARGVGMQCDFHLAEL